MFSEKNIVVTIGNFGTVIAVHDGNDIKSKLLVEELNDETKTKVEEVLNKFKLAPIYILIDTVDQSYKKKTYPHVKKSDLIKIATRDMNSDGDSESLKNFIVLNGKKSKKPVKQKKWECLFVSATTSETINNWIEFLSDTPNRVIGIYMLPIESFNLFNLLKKSIKSKSKIQNKRNDLYCLIMQNKVSGTRQVVFSEEGVVFTRLVNYNFEDADFLEKYEQDIYSTFEYLKRLYPDLIISELEVVNILSKEALDKLSSLKNIELNTINYTPFKAALEIGQKTILPQNSGFCDLLVSKAFSKGKKLLKFSTGKINLLEKYFLTLRFSYYFNLFLALAISGSIFFTVYNKSAVYEKIENIENVKFSTLDKLHSLKIKALKASGESEELAKEDENVSFERITDFGKIDEALEPIGTDIADFYLSLMFLKDYSVKLSIFSYVLSGFRPDSPIARSVNYNISLKGEIFNESGDIEDLFRDFDLTVSEVKKRLENKTVKHSELPKNIDFNKKYYSFPVNFTITDK